MRPTATCIAIALAGIVLMPGGASCEEVYKTVDKDGHVTYSDKPSDNAQPVAVKPTNRMTETATPQRAPEAAPAASERPYSVLAFTNPFDGATITDPVGNITVQYSLDPPRRPSDQVRLLMDKAPTGAIVDDGILVRGATRGEHELQLQVVGPRDEVLAESLPIRIEMVRPGPGGSRPPARPTPH